MVSQLQKTMLNWPFLHYLILIKLQTSIVAQQGNVEALTFQLIICKSFTVLDPRAMDQRQEFPSMLGALSKGSVLNSSPFHRVPLAHTEAKHQQCFYYKAYQNNT